MTAKLFLHCIYSVKKSFFLVTLFFCNTSFVFSSFAYDTVQTRIPHILTKVIDTCHRHISVSQQSHGEVRFVNIYIV